MQTRRVLALAALGALLLWLAMPPIDWGWLGPAAPVAWIWLVRQPRPLGRRGYLALWAAYALFWMALLHWLRYLHPAIYLGWFAMSAYMGAYLPLFVGLSRAGVHRCRLNVVVVAPVVWTGLELARAHLLTGFTIGSLGHTLYRWPVLIQTADLGGAYTVTFLVMALAACLGRVLPLGRERLSWREAWPVVTAAALLGATWVYGTARLGAADALAQREPPLLTAGLIQGSIDIHVKADPGAQERIYADYLRLSLDAVRRYDDLDVLIWPETMYRSSLFTFADDARLPQRVEGRLEYARENDRFARQGLTDLQRAVGLPMLVGVDVMHIGSGTIERFNSAVLVDGKGEIAARYDKMHPVMFGEYIPLGDVFPWLYDLTGGALPSGCKPGTQLETFDVAGARMVANICYETTVPHLLRRQVRQLRARGQEPDVLVNLTNDGWFYGASELDLHLISGLFRAVELRKPLLIAANTGFSASVDTCGRIQARGKRRQEDILRGEVRRCQLRSWYTTVGDLPAGGCLVACLAMAGVALRERRRSRRAQTA